MNSTQSIWVCGEALIDLIPNRTDRTAPKTPVVGGGPANTAAALAKLGYNAQFINGISTSDDFGRMINAQLDDNKVDLSLAHFTNKPTCTADVTLDDNGGASYIFTFDGTATFDYTNEWLPQVKDHNPALLHIGTLVTIIEPAASLLVKWAKEVSKDIPILLDPNIRPSVIPDVKKYQALIDPWIDVATLIKVSDDDITWLYPEKSESEVVEGWLSRGCKAVVITRGASGISAFMPGKRIDVPGAKIVVADTVGAGDTVGAVIAEALFNKTWGFAADGSLHASDEDIKKVLTRAAVAAGITCSRVGANPPTSAEIDHALAAL
jgi:fructokinase